MIAEFIGWYNVGGMFFSFVFGIIIGIVICGPEEGGKS
jgi:tetrahydromethanopterin S-methyltransferase subunit B